jgi:hypothetical protein
MRIEEPPETGAARAAETAARTVAHRKWSERKPSINVVKPMELLRKP